MKSGAIILFLQVDDLTLAMVEWELAQGVAQVMVRFFAKVASALELVAE